jgi:hypothetical protein
MDSDLSLYRHHQGRFFMALSRVYKLSLWCKNSTLDRVRVAPVVQPRPRQHQPLPGPPRDQHHQLRRLVGDVDKREPQQGRQLPQQSSMIRITFRVWSTMYMYNGSTKGSLSTD